jgi:hypothetical protein
LLTGLIIDIVWSQIACVLDDADDIYALIYLPSARSMENAITE